MERRSWIRPKEEDERGGKGMTELDGRLGRGEVGKYGDIFEEGWRLKAGRVDLDGVRRPSESGSLRSSGSPLMGEGGIGLDGAEDKGESLQGNSVSISWYGFVGVEGRS